MFSSILLGSSLSITPFTPESFGTTAIGAGEVAPTGSMTSPRSGHTANLLPNGLVLVAGGMERNGAIYDACATVQVPERAGPVE
jgi:hypothetical protein